MIDTVQDNALYLAYNLNLLTNWYDKGVGNFIDLIYNDVPKDILTI